MNGMMAGTRADACASDIMVQARRLQAAHGGRVLRRATRRLGAVLAHPLDVFATRFDGQLKSH